MLCIDVIQSRKTVCHRCMLYPSCEPISPFISSLPSALFTLQDKMIDSHRPSSFLPFPISRNPPHVPDTFNRFRTAFIRPFGFHLSCWTTCYSEVCLVRLGIYVMHKSSGVERMVESHYFWAKTGISSIVCPEAGFRKLYASIISSVLPLT